MHSRRAAVLGRAVLVLALALVGGLPAAADGPAPKQAPPKAAPKKAPAKEAPKAAPQKAPAKAAPKPAAKKTPPEESEPPPPPFEFPDEGIILKKDGDVLYFYRTNFVAPAELKASLTTLLKVPNVTLKEFARQNILLIEGDPDAVEIAIEAAAYFDVSTPQVFIEAKVIEITYESNFEFGIDYLFSRAEVGPETLWQGAEGFLPPPSWIGSQLPGGLPFQGSSLLFGLIGDTANAHGLGDLAVRAMELEGKAEVLSKPSIVASQGVKAEVETNEARLINTYERADRNNEYYKASTINSGVKLTVLAKHIGENFVTMEIEPMVNGIQGLTATTGGTLMPIQTRRRAKTTVTMGDGETLVIGGLYTNTCVSDKAKTPLISDIPLLGKLFTRTKDSKVKTELVFMLTPTIIRKTSEFKVITPPAELERLEGKEEDCARPCRTCDAASAAEPEEAPEPEPAPETCPEPSAYPCARPPTQVIRRRPVPGPACPPQPVPPK